MPEHYWEEKDGRLKPVAPGGGPSWADCGNCKDKLFEKLNAVHADVIETKQKVARLEGIREGENSVRDSHPEMDAGRKRMTARGWITVVTLVCGAIVAICATINSLANSWVENMAKQAVAAAMASAKEPGK